jgi:ribosomal protein L34E
MRRQWAAKCASSFKLGSDVTIPLGSRSLRCRAVRLSLKSVKFHSKRRYAIQTVCALTNSCIPKCESSRPYPLRLTPPNGRRGSDTVIALM